MRPTTVARSRALCARSHHVGSVLSPGCARRSDGASKVSATATVPTRGAASALPSSQPLPSALTAALPPPHKLDVSFEVTRDPNLGEQTLWGNVPSLGIRQVIGRAKPPLVYGVPSQPPGVEPSRRRSRVTVADCGDEDEALPIKVEGDTLLLGTAEIKVPERSFIVHEELTQPLPPVRDCSKAGKTRVLISVKRDAKVFVWRFRRCT